MTFVGAFVAQANRVAGGDLADEGVVGCEGMIDEINNDMWSMASGETFDSEMDEEWELL